MSDVALDTSTGKLVTIRLYGRLGARFGRVHRLAVQSAAEAVRALCALHDGFEQYLMSSKDRGEGYAVFYGKKNLHEDNLRDPNFGGEDIRIAPFALGAGSGWVRIIVGIVLVVVGTVFSEFGFGFLVPIGWSMIVGGVIQLLTPVPKGRSSKDKADNTPNTSFNGPINTEAQGHPVPVLYGELIVGSAVVSAGILASDVYVADPALTGKAAGPFGAWVKAMGQND